jgi:hypothetical protein
MHAISSSPPLECVIKVSFLDKISLSSQNACSALLDAEDDELCSSALVFTDTFSLEHKMSELEAEL